MPTPFHGSYDELRGIIETVGVEGEWEEKPNACFHFKAKGGAGLNWSANKGTIWLDGPPAQKAVLNEKWEGFWKGHGKEAAASAPKEQMIFVVHGHDHVAKEQLELILHRLGLEPYVLQDQSSGGKTIIEALESMIGKEARSAFGIVLMTPDDIGYAKKDGDKEAKARARQNVILETGMLLSSLTRTRVAILQKGFVESPSDLHGVLVINFNEHVKETVPKLAQRLQECGINISAAKVAQASS